MLAEVGAKYRERSTRLVSLAGSEQRLCHIEILL